jgi:hypothetical protein
MKATATETISVRIACQFREISCQQWLIFGPILNQPAEGKSSRNQSVGSLGKVRIKRGCNLTERLNLNTKSEDGMRMQPVVSLLGVLKELSHST